MINASINKRIVFSPTVCCADTLVSRFGEYIVKHSIISSGYRTPEIDLARFSGDERLDQSVGLIKEMVWIENRHLDFVLILDLFVRWAIVVIRDELCFGRVFDDREPLLAFMAKRALQAYKQIKRHISGEGFSKVGPQNNSYSECLFAFAVDCRFGQDTLKTGHGNARFDNIFNNPSEMGIM